MTKWLNPPGIAFSLTPDYGTAAIYFEDGTFVKVAKIEGNPGYKEFMNTREATQSPRNTLCDIIPQRLQYFIRQLSLCPQDTNTRDAKSLLQALQHAMESYIGTNFCYASIVVPNPDMAYQRQVIETSLHDIGLRQVLRTLYASRLVLIANNVSFDASRDSYPDEEVILTNDFSRSVVDTALFCESIGVADAIRRNYQPDLQIGDATPKYWQDLKAEIQRIVEPPFENSPIGQDLGSTIHQLVIYGDNVDNKHFLGILEGVVGTDLVGRAFVFNPVFAAAVGMAHELFRYMARMEFNAKSAFGCRWRSGLYHGEL